APAPALPPCGLNANSARTWVDFYDSRGKRLYGFCALGSPNDLGQIWFATEEGTIPPSYVYIEIKDRQTNTTYKSNLADTTLEAAGVRLTGAHAVKDPRKLRDTVRDALDAGAPMVIVGGGDGTLSSTVDEIVGKDCAFAVLPLGTANSFARSLGIPLDLEGAVRTIAEGELKRIDLGVIDGDYYANCAALGL